MTQNLSKFFASRYQTTIERPVRCEGIGLHKGQNVSMLLLPASAGTGVIFHRTDVAMHTGIVPAHYGNVTETTLGTTVSNAHGATVSTIEHLMAAFWGMGVDNVRVEINAPELPIVDGSSAPFVKLIGQAGIVRLSAPREEIEILQPVEVKDGRSIARIEPFDGFALSVEIEYPGRVIPRQHAHYDFRQITFSDVLAEARTFGFASEVDKMRSMGLALGGSLNNAIVVGEDSVLNAEGLRFEDEFVRHKALDCVGDLALAGMHIRGHVITSRPGHNMNNRLLRALMANRAAWHIRTRGKVMDRSIPFSLPQQPQPQAASHRSASAAVPQFAVSAI